MRAGSDDTRNPIVVQRLNVVVGHHLEEKLVPGAAGGVARAIFLGPQDGETDTGFFKDQRKRPGDLLGPLVETPGATDPKQYVGCGAGRLHFRHRWYY